VIFLFVGKAYTKIWLIDSQWYQIYLMGRYRVVSSFQQGPGDIILHWIVW
jgi:hypothetical protein